MASMWTYVTIVCAIIFIGYMELKKRSSKSFCIVKVVENRGNGYVDHAKAYKGIIKISKDRTGDSVKWFMIPKLKINWRIPKTEEMILNNAKGSTLNVAWYGGNNLRVLKLVSDKVRLVKQKDGKYKAQKVKDPLLDVQDDSMRFLDSKITERVKDLWKKDMSRWEKLAPTIAIGLVGIFCLAMVWTTSKNIAKANEDLEQAMSNGEKIVSGLERLAGKEVAPDTIIKPRIEQNKDAQDNDQGDP